MLLTLHKNHEVRVWFGFRSGSGSGSGSAHDGGYSEGSGMGFMNRINEEMCLSLGEDKIYIHIYIEQLIMTCFCMKIDSSTGAKQSRA